MAQWSTKCTYTGNCIIWQYSETGKVDGISNNTNLDYLQTHIYDTITSKGFNGYFRTSETITYNYDANGDGVIDEKDLIALQEYLEIQRRNIGDVAMEVTIIGLVGTLFGSIYRNILRKF